MTEEDYRKAIALVRRCRGCDNGYTTGIYCFACRLRYVKTELPQPKPLKDSK